ncbi:ketoacyl-ACP synthase III family protein [Actinokineospora xionganensis]|uniref:Ketoacyl-ACP synthase III family protein n=1 Tax=Actinokineospora xionganensis TaxID=2684470 RepID=A0ABR7L011_9PSEU|nr:ketoacyl-ACP synthase III family protein [Actinokineospora xionganensis]MBC6445974.1 ketoacyl-ACP synthase III family protein [Actinokineospora xionganensis]
MVYEDLYIAGAGSWLPKTVSVEEAVADGRCEQAAAQRTRTRRVAIAGPEDSQPDMAVHAGKQALLRSGHDPADVNLVLHAVANYNGLDGWNAASYVQHHTVGQSGVSYEIRQLSNGGVASIQLAAAYLGGTPGGAALITASDKFTEPAWNRWRASAGLLFADGASAVVLSRRSGFARVRSALTVSDPELEGLQRGEQPFRDYADPAQYPVELEARTLEFSDVMPLDESGPRRGAGMRTAARQALAAADLKMSDINRFVAPNFGYELMRLSCLVPLGIELEQTTWEWGSQVGHTGAADQFATLAHLVETREVSTGDHVMLIGVGGGFNWTAVVLEILDVPDWSVGA